MSYIPSKPIHPGVILSEILTRGGMSQTNLCERTGLSEKHISQIIGGKVSITIETSLLLENALGGSASFWINLEKDYQEIKARIETNEKIKNETKLLKSFPYLELIKRGYVDQTSDPNKRVENLWKFFGVNSLEYIQQTQAVAFRKKNKNNVNEKIAAWLRCGEVDFADKKMPEYNETELKNILPKLKQLSIKKAEDFSTETVKMLEQVGVALQYTPHFKGTGVSGAMRWLNSNPLIQISLLGSYSDMFWFNLYHEMGHIILHGKKEKFIEFNKPEESDKETEANNFARDNLIPQEKYDEFVNGNKINKENILNFADELKIQPGIIVGRLCHEGKLNWKDVSQMRTKLKFA